MRCPAEPAAAGQPPEVLEGPFTTRQLLRLDEALRLADRSTGLTFSVYVGEPGRAGARARGAAARPARRPGARGADGRVAQSASARDRHRRRARSRYPTATASSPRCRWRPPSPVATWPAASSAASPSSPTTPAVPSASRGRPWHPCRPFPCATAQSHVNGSRNPAWQDGRRDCTGQRRTDVLRDGRRRADVPKLVDEFYAGVANDPLLRPLYPEEDLGAAAERLRLFLIQYWGGPGTYSQQRGHPRLRMRHAPFRVGPRRARRVARAHAPGRRRLGLPPEQDEQLWQYLERAAFFMVNTFDE